MVTIRREQPPSSVFDYVKIPMDYAWTLANRAATGVASGVLIKKIHDSAVENMYCFANYFSLNTRANFATLGSCLGLISSGAVSIFYERSNVQMRNETPAFAMLIGVACEEVECRWLLQEVGLRRLPKKIIKQIFPAMADLVDSMPVRLARVVTSAAAFGLLHGVKCSNGGGISQFISGLALGGIYEFSGSLTQSISFHFGMNWYFFNYPRG